MIARHLVSCVVSFILLVPIVLSVSSEWKVVKFPAFDAKKMKDRKLIHLIPNPSELCVLDTLTIDWNMIEEEISTTYLAADFSLIILPDREEAGLEISLSNVHQNQFERQTPLLTCLMNEIVCQLKTEDITLLSSESKMTLKFDQETNQPELSTKEAVEKVLAFTPPLQYNVTTVWKDPKVLELQLDPRDVALFTESYHSGQVTEVVLRGSLLRSAELPKAGSRVFRTSEHGVFQVFVANLKTMEILSNVHTVTVNLCSERTVLPSARFKWKSDKPANVAFSMHGIFPISGNRPITVTNKAVPAIDEGTWSIAMWIKLLQEPTGSFRAIMFKGSPESGFSQRTPSAWLMPNTNHVTLRVSTEKNPDTEITTHAALPINDWAHLCFVFQNDSAIRGSKKEDFTVAKSDDLSITPPTNIQPPADFHASSNTPNYTVDVYFNGVLDISAAYRNTVLGNNASLTLFKDVSFLGPKSFVEGLKVWNGALTDVQVKEIYSEGLRFNQPVDEVLRLLEVSKNPLLPSYKSSSTNLHPNNPSTLENGTDIVSVDGKASPDSSNVDDKDIPEKRSINQGILELLMKQSKESIAECQSYIQRMDIHSESSEMGSMEGLLYWSKLLYYGFETVDSKCGFSSTSSDIQLQKQHKKMHSSSKASYGSSSYSTAVSTLLEQKRVVSIQSIDENLRDLSRAVYTFLLAIEEGQSEGLLSLAFTLLHGLGLESIIYYDQLLQYDWDIPIYLEDDFYEFQRSHNHFRKALGERIVSEAVKCNRNLSDEWIGYSVLCSPTISDRKKVSVDLVNQISLGLIYLAALYDDVDAYVALAYRYEHGIGGVIADIEMAAQYSLYPADVASNVFHTVGAQPIIETDRIDDNTEPDIGKGNQGNDDELIQYQKIRAEEGDVPSMLAMGDLYYFGARGLPRDQSMALRYFSQAANLGDPQGMCGAAAMYLKGEGTSANVSKAVELYEKAAENASIRAYNGLGFLYFFGSQVPKNETKAFEYFQLAAQFENDGDSLFNSGYCLEHGIGTEKDLSKAVYHYTVAAKKTGHFDSVKILAMFHMEGKGVVRSAKEALTFLNAAKGIGPWMGWIRRGLDLYLASKSSPSIISSLTSTQNVNPLVKSLLCYLYAGELGYEVAQSNAAYILRSKIVPTIIATDQGLAISATPATDNPTAPSALTVSKWHNSETLFNRLLFHQYLLSGKQHLQMENIFYLGNCYFFMKCGLLLSSEQKMNPAAAVAQFQFFRKKAMYYYQIASYGRNPLASAYLGMIYHFNLHSSSFSSASGVSIGDQNTHTNNFLRANRYYQEVLDIAKDPHSPANQQSAQLYYFVKLLQTILQWRSYSALYPFHQLTDEVMRWFWA